MPGPQAVPIVLSDVERQHLEKITRQLTAPQRLVQRSRIALCAAAGLSNAAIAREVHCSRGTVVLWPGGSQSFAWPDCRTSRDRDAPGPFPPQQRHEVIALACSHPPDHGFAMTNWSLRTLARAASQQCLVEQLAPETLRRWLLIADLRLHRYRSWLYSHDPLFAERLQEIVALYTQPPAHSRVYCLDERTGMQALEYWAAETGARPGRPGRREFHYTRHGTRTLFGCL